MSFLWRKDMTREDAKKLLPIIEAYANGETVQIRKGDYWGENEYYTFAGSPNSYRIKPKPREFWVNEYTKGVGDYLYKSEVIAVNDAENDEYIKTIHLIEVLDE